MKNILAVATTAVMALAPMTPVFAQTQAAKPSTAAAAPQKSSFDWNGKWQGMSVSGQAIVLDLKVTGLKMTGKLTVGKQSADIIAGKIAGEAFALSTGKIDGAGVDATGRHVGDSIELTITGVKTPLTLTRVA
jgi:hypothetical protein